MRQLDPWVRATRAKAVEAFQLADKESGFSRRKLIRTR